MPWNGVNALVGQERAVVSEIPGTTRDSIDTAVEFDGRRVVLVDTAGIRRRGRVEEGIEKYALLRTARALERADVAILLTDATEGVTAQDVHIAGYALEASVGLVLAVNKWDVVDRGPEMTSQVEAEIAREFHFLPWMPHRFVSAKTGRGVRETLADALAIVDERRRRVQTSELHRLLVEAVAAHPPSQHRGREVRFTHVTQARGKAPTFVFFVEPPEGVHFTYLRYLENRLREQFGFKGTPIKLELKGAKE
jgi:GTP-binding protein